MMDKEESIKKLQEKIDKAANIVFFGGAGVSTESGIPDFRSKDGLYNQRFAYPPEVMLSHSFFVTHPGEFFDFYKTRILILDKEPNAAHLKLAELERAGKLSAVITQNIDELHQKAGSKVVYELHGSIYRNYCTKCGRSYPPEYIKEATGVPECEDCGGIIKPDVVLYEEGLNSRTLEGAVNAIASADMLIIGGTSLVVYPAAGLIDYFRGQDLVLINKSATGKDRTADLVITEPIGEVFSQIKCNIP